MPHTREFRYYNLNTLRKELMNEKNLSVRGEGVDEETSSRYCAHMWEKMKKKGNSINVPTIVHRIVYYSKVIVSELE